MNRGADPGLATARRVYRSLTRVYPAAFRRTYWPLMVQLFCDQYRAARAAAGPWGLARFWLHIVGDLTASVLREHADEFRSATMNQERTSAVILGMLLFVLLGAADVLFAVPIPLIGVLASFVGYLLVLGLLLAGWRAGFPRWVYPYLGYALIFPLNLSNVSTPGLALLGLPIWGREHWGWRAFVPLGFVVVLALVFNRSSWGNLVGLVRHAWEDWTLLAFSLFGLLPMVVTISLDEVEHAFAFWPKMAGTLLVILGAFLYMRLARPGLRYLVLLACTFTAVAVMSGGASYYWSTHDIDFTTGAILLVTTSVEWPGVLSTAASQASLVVLILLGPLPLALALTRLVHDRSRSGQLSLL